MKIPKHMILDKIKEKSGLTDEQIQSKVKDKLDQLSGLISEEGALHIIANELGVKIYEDPGNLQIKNIVAGMRSVELSGKVVDVYEVREFKTEKREGKVGAFMLGDETGVVRVVLWNNKADLLSKLNKGDLVKLEQGYTRDNRGRMEVHAGDKTTLTVNPGDMKDIAVKEKQLKQIKDLRENESNAEIMGTIVQVFDPRFFPVDPDSGKKLNERDGQFYFQDKLIAQPGYSYVTNVFLDDGTDNIRVVLWRDQSQKLFGVSHEDMVTNKDSGFEEQKNELLGKIVKFVGRTHKNEMFDRVEFVANAVFTDPDPKQELKRLEEVAANQPKEETVSEPVQIKSAEDQLKEQDPSKQETIPTKAPVVKEEVVTNKIESVEKVVPETTATITTAQATTPKIEQNTQADAVQSNTEQEAKEDSDVIEEIDLGDLDSL